MIAAHQDTETNSELSTQNPGKTEINPNTIYSRLQVMEIMGWREKAWKSAVRKGLRTHCHARRDYVCGSELLRFITSLYRKGNPVNKDMEGDA